MNSNNIYIEDQKLQKSHLIEQYKIYVEMADRISSRRNLANVFFLTLHTTFFSVERIQLIELKLLILFPFSVLLIFCWVWWKLIKSYRCLNSAKYKVIGELEKELPVSPYWSMEWKELGEGKDPKKYVPLTAIENIVPLAIGILYICMAVYLLCLS